MAASAALGKDIPMKRVSIAAIAAMMITAPAMAQEAPLTCLQAVRALASIARTDYDRSDDIDINCLANCPGRPAIGAKASLMAIADFARGTEVKCAKELGK
jgi:hypothetical protein